VRLVVVAARPPRVSIPTDEAPTWARDVVANVSKNRSGALLADAIATTLGGCEPLIEAFNPATFREGEDKGTQILRRIPDAVERCACLGIDVDSLELLTIVTTMVLETAPGWLEVRFSSTGEDVTSDDSYGHFVRAVGDVPPDRRRAGIHWASRGSTKP
jgi:hypothetical protein